ncbi:MAG: hypothetical protein IIX27_07720 [Ruminococcus sp.]|nr:hypothetical protein [Ruminococcus sp.]
MESITKFIRLVFKAVSLAMGVAVVALLIMNKIDTHNALMLLGIGVAGSGVAHLMDRSDK